MIMTMETDLQVQLREYSALSASPHLFHFNPKVSVQLIWRFLFTLAYFWNQVVVENVSQPTLDNLYAALEKAYGVPRERVWAIKHNWGKHEWIRLTPELGVKKVNGRLRLSQKKSWFQRR